jgi:arylsulfatase A-like enzyme
MSSHARIASSRARLALTGLLVAAAWSERATAQQPLAKPNVVVIQADDLGYGDLSAYGQTQFQTPSLDRLAREGIRFTQYYAGSTVCAPSRTALMTGLHTGHTWIRGNGEIALRPEDVTIAEVLKTAGYRTAVVGKWGVSTTRSAFSITGTRTGSTPITSGATASASPSTSIAST